MDPVVTVAIHASQFPERVRHDLIHSLRAREVNHKFLYDSVKQTEKWLALHQAYSPSRTDANCIQMYDSSFAGSATRASASNVHLVSLGCGGGQKDTRLIRVLKKAGKEVLYTPTDVSLALVLIARQGALTEVACKYCHPLVLDLASVDDLSGVLADQTTPEKSRLVSFLGMIPNFEPQQILPLLSSLLRGGDLLLLNANLAPGSDYASGMARILPQYDNALTRDWLMTFLLDLGVEPNDGQLRFAVEDGPAESGLRRVVARFHFGQTRLISVSGERIEFRAGDNVRLFFSYRHTPELLESALAPFGLSILDRWITDSGEEGIFLCAPRERAPAKPNA